MNDRDKKVLSDKLDERLNKVVEEWMVEAGELGMSGGAILANMAFSLSIMLEIVRQTALIKGIEPGAFDGNEIKTRKKVIIGCEARRGLDKS